MYIIHKYNIKIKKDIELNNKMMYIRITKTIKKSKLHKNIGETKRYGIVKRHIGSLQGIRSDSQ